MQTRYGHTVSENIRPGCVQFEKKIDVAHFKSKSKSHDFDVAWLLRIWEHQEDYVA